MIFYDLCVKKIQIEFKMFVVRQENPNYAISTQGGPFKNVITGDPLVHAMNPIVRVNRVCLQHPKNYEVF